jgi:hypothetical protein
MNTRNQSKVNSLFNRPVLAREMAESLITPKALEIGFRSGLLLSGVRRTGKTTFVVQDLIPAIENLGAIVVYVDLWSDTLTNPSILVNTAVRNTLEQLQTPASGLLQKLGRVSGVDAGGFGFKFGFKLDSIGTKGSTTLAEVFKSVVDQAKTDVVLIIDEVQHAILTEEGKSMLLSLKAARDAINSRPNTPGYFIFVGTGSHRAQVSELRAGRNQAFEGAMSVDYPLLGKEYVEHLLAKVAADEPELKLPSLEVAFNSFRTLGHRPEQMLLALMTLNNLPIGGAVDTIFPVIAATLRGSIADVEFSKIEEMGFLAKAVFDRIANQVDTKGIYSKEAIAEYSQQLNRPVLVDELQTVINGLLASNLIMRKGHGSYIVTDPYFAELWTHRKLLSQ